MAKKRLGQGFDELFADNMIEDNGGGGKTMIRIALIEPKPGQPRKTFESEPLAQLADSIATFGVLQPVLLREIPGGRYQIVAGERRWRASKMAGLTEIPAIVFEGSEQDAAEIALVENVQREDLNPLEEAMGYRALAEDFGLTQEALSQRIGKSRSAIANAMRLLDLPDAVLSMVASGDLSAGHARTLLSLRDAEDEIYMAKKTVELDLSVRSLENEVKKYLKKKKEAEDGRVQPSPALVNYVAELEKRMQRHLGRKVKISDSGKKKCITLFFEDNEDLDQLLQTLCGSDFLEEA